jgi:hypothetical protein
MYSRASSSPQWFCEELAKRFTSRDRPQVRRAGAEHGGGEDGTGWTKQGLANFTLDNLIAAGICKPMIRVMAYGYARRAGQPEPDLT